MFTLNDSVRVDMHMNGQALLSRDRPVRILKFVQLILYAHANIQHAYGH